MTTAKMINHGRAGWRCSPYSFLCQRFPCASCRGNEGLVMRPTYRVPDVNLLRYFARQSRPLVTRCSKRVCSSARFASMDVSTLLELCEYSKRSSFRDHRPRRGPGPHHCLLDRSSGTPGSQTGPFRKSPSAPAFHNHKPDLGIAAHQLHRAPRWRKDRQRSAQGLIPSAQTVA
jgi:hypothetical protein